MAERSSGDKTGPEAQSQVEDPVAAYKAALKEVTRDYKDKIVAPKERRKNESKTAMEFDENLAGYFGNLAQSGKYEEMADIPFELWIKNLANAVAETTTGSSVEGLPEEEKAKKIKEEAAKAMGTANIDSKIAKLKEVQAIMATDKERPVEIRETPKMKSATANLEIYVENIQRELAAVLKDWSDKLNWHYRTETEALGKSIDKEREEDYLVTAEFRPAKETYENYKKNLVEQFSEQQFAKNPLNNFNYRFWVKIQRQFGETFGNLTHGKTIEETRRCFAAFNAEAEGLTEKETDDTQEIYVRHFGEWAKPMYKKDWSKFSSDRKTFAKLLPLLEQAARVENIFHEAITAFSEEKLKNVIKVIDREFKTEAEREKNLREFLLTVKDREVASHTSSGDKDKTYEVVYPAMIQENGEVPKWFFSAYKEFNEIAIFRKVAMSQYDNNNQTYNGLGWDLLTNEVMRGEVEGQPVVKGAQERRVAANRKDFCVTMLTVPKKEVNKSAVGFEFPDGFVFKEADVFVKALATRKMMVDNGYDEEKSNNSWAFRSMSGLNMVLPRRIFGEAGEAALTDPADRKVAENFQKTIDRKVSAQRPTARERINALGMEPGGVVSVTPEKAIELLEAFQVLYRRKLAAAERKVANEKVKTTDLEQKNLELNIRLKTLEDELKATQGVVKEKIKERDETGDKLKEVQEAMRTLEFKQGNQSQTVEHLLSDIKKAMEESAGMTGLMSAGKKNKVYENLIAQMETALKVMKETK